MKHLKQPVARRANLEDDRTGHFFEQRFYSGALLTEEALVAAMAYVDLNPVRAELAERIEEIRDTSIRERLLENSAEALADYLRPVLSGLDRPPVQPGASPNVVAVVEPSVVASTETPIPQDAASGNQPEGDLGLPDPERPCDEKTDEADAETAARSRAHEPDPADRRGRSPRLPRAHVTLGQYVELVGAMAGAENTPSGNTPDRVGRWLARTKALHKRQRAYGSESALRHCIADRAMQLREARLTPDGAAGASAAARHSPGHPVHPESASILSSTGVSDRCGVGGPAQAWVRRSIRCHLANISYRRGNGIACVRESSHLLRAACAPPAGPV